MLGAAPEAVQGCVGSNARAAVGVSALPIWESGHSDLWRLFGLRVTRAGTIPIAACLIPVCALTFDGDVWTCCYLWSAAYRDP